MSQNKNALLRYRTIDRCLRNTLRRWTLLDLVEACSDALYDYEGRVENVSVRSVQRDIEMMRSDKLGYFAPIEVYDRKFYRYSDPDYSISTRPLSEHDINALNRTIDLLRQFDEFDPLHEMADVVNRLQDKVASAEKRRVIVDFDRNPDLKGLGFLNQLYDMVAMQKVIDITYQSFKALAPSHIIVHPHLLKEYNNRWFLICSKDKNNELLNLALDRMIAVEVADGLEYRDNPVLTNDYYSDVIGVTKHSGLSKGNVLFTAQSAHANYILTKPFHSSQRLVAKNPDGSMTFELPGIIINPELKRLLLGFGSGLKVISPKTLAEDLRRTFKKAAKLYD